MHLMTRSSARVSAYWPLGLAERGAHAVDEDDLSQLSGHQFSFGAPRGASGGDSGAGYPAVTTRRARPGCGGRHPTGGRCGDRGPGISWGDAGAARPRRDRCAERPWKDRPCPRNPGWSTSSTTCPSSTTAIAEPDDGARARRVPRRRQRRRASRRRHLVGPVDGGGRVVATFDVDEFHDYRARRPAMSFVRDHYESYDAPRLVVRLLARRRRHAVPPAARPRAGQPLGGVRRAPSARSSSASASPGSSGWARCRWRCRTPGRSRSPHHANNPELIAGDSPWRGELRIPSQRPGAARAAAGGVGARRDGLRRAHPALPRPARLPAGVRGPARARRARRPADHRPVRAARPRPSEREAEIARYLAANEEVGEVVHGARAAVRRVRARRGERQQPARRRPAAADR